MAADDYEHEDDIVRERLKSLDVYRGMIMVSLAFGGFGLAKTATNHLQTDPDSSFWRSVQYQFSHAQWVGCSFWDLIQPSFMFMVGVSMAYSYAKREEMEQSYRRMFLRALFRSIFLIFLGVFLISNGQDATTWSLVNVLTQIGLGYTFLFLLWGKSFRAQSVAAVVILLGTALLYLSYPAKGLDVDTGAPHVGVEAAWAKHYLKSEDIGAAWHKNANIGHATDVWLLNLLPRTERFEYNSGGYATINFIPSLATMIFGLMCGELLRSDRNRPTKLVFLLVAGVIGLLLGELLHYPGICPLVKRIWTPAWVLFSGGWCCVILATLFGLVDMLRLRFWTYPFVVVGMNSIAIYCMSMLLKPWVASSFKTHFGSDAFERIAETYFGSVANGPFVQSTMIGLVFWAICWWLYRNRIFIRI